MTLTTSYTVTPDGLHREYTGTVVRGKRKGETVTARVINAGFGWKVFWDKVERHFGCKCYTAS